MSFVDLATLTMHRRNELEGRINVFDEKCNRAISDIKKLKAQAHSFVPRLNCEPVELKERFLMSMKKLDEYMYLITDFNLAIAQLEEVSSSEYTPVQDNCMKPLPPTFQSNLAPFNLMDALSEPTPSTSCACPNNCPPEKPKRVKVPKEDMVLIAFSSSSSSSESVPNGKAEIVTEAEAETVTKEVQCQTNLVEDISNVTLEEPTSADPEPCKLPPQTMLETEHAYPGTIMTIDGAFFWIIADDVEEVQNFMTEMTDYYKQNRMSLSKAEVKSLTYCAYYDDESDCFYRALFFKEDEEDSNKVDLFVVDTGEVRSATIECLAPLVAQFCARPPYARSCHLAGVELPNYNKKHLMKTYEAFMREYVGTPCTIEVDDNTSESLGVYVVLPSNETLNDLVISNQLAIPIEKSSAESVGTVKLTPSKYRVISARSESEGRVVQGPPPKFSLSDIDITEGPEYEDPVEAVTGYHNRDEADICKHYKGNPERTCFKGSRCTKKHIMKHPDGWTLDRVEILVKLPSVPLPEPDTWHRVLVTNVCHFDRVYVQLLADREQEETVPEFGVVLPPMTLEGLVRDMNSPATCLAYKPLKLTPAPGELVAAKYPLDSYCCWYRARVLTTNRHDQSVEVMYVDYGTVLWVKEDQIRVLEPRFTVLPSQAIRCVIAGISIESTDSHQWAAAKRALTDLVQDERMDCQVVARNYDEITVHLFDCEGYCVAERLAASNLVVLSEVCAVDDAAVSRKLVVP